MDRTLSPAGVAELDADEMKRTDGGLVMLLALGALLLLGGCASCQNPAPKPVP